MKIISLFSRSGHMLEPWAIAGHDVLSIDSHEATHTMPHCQRRAITPKGFAWAVYQHLIKDM